MRKREPWLCVYAHDRRKHRHRCQVCHRIVNAGESVWMARVGNRTTRVVHAEKCADMVSEPTSGTTALALLAAHAGAWE